MEFELLSCPECSEPLLEDLRDYANDSREYEGQFGHVCEWHFRDVELECPGCGCSLLLNGSIVDDGGTEEQDIEVTPNQG